MSLFRRASRAARPIGAINHHGGPDQQLSGWCAGHGWRRRRFRFRNDLQLDPIDAVFNKEKQKNVKSHHDVDICTITERANNPVFALRRAQWVATARAWPYLGRPGPPWGDPNNGALALHCGNVIILGFRSTFQQRAKRKTFSSLGVMPRHFVGAPGIP